MARALVTSNHVWISRTVLLETAWVLLDRFRIDPKELVAILAQLIRIPTVSVEDRVGLRGALAWSLAGLDIADAIHLSVRPASVFATFDRELARTAASLPNTPTVRLLGGA